MSVEKATEAIIKKFRAAVATLPAVLGNEAVNHSLAAFKAQAWEGQQWRRRLYSKKQGPSILVGKGTGHLRRSVRVISSNARGFVYGSDLPYAKAHNDGFSGTVQVPTYKRNKYTKSKIGTGKLTKSGKERTKTVTSVSGETTVKAHSKKMNLPKRQFAGKSQSLINRLTAAGKNHLLKAF